MRLLKLRFKNINSLAGEYEIDFTDRAFVESGIFAITGPTGSGKSSILDAVTLALFGKTPRSTATPEGSTVKEKCPYMTKNRTECYAAVVFEIDDEIWFSRWSQSYTKKGTSLREAAVELVRLRSIDDERGEIVVEKKKAWERAIEELIGMNFDSFTRCVLLAQGAFASLINAPVNKRAEILEKITGTSIYSRIGGEVFTCFKREEEKVKRLQSELELRIPMTDEERAALEAARKVETEKSDENAAALADIRKALDLRKTLDAAEATLAEVRLKFSLAQKENEDLKPLSVQCVRARAALVPLEKFEASRKAARDAASTRAQLAENRKKAESEKEALKQEEASKKMADLADKASRKALDEFMPIFKAASDADTEIKTFRETLEIDRKARDAAAKRACLAAEELKKVEDNEAVAIKTLEALKTDIEETRADDLIAEHLSGIEAAVEAHRNAQKQHTAAQMALKNAEDDEKSAIAENAKAQSVAIETKRIADEAQAEAGRLREAYEIAMAGSSLAQYLEAMRLAASNFWASSWLLALQTEIAKADEVLADDPADDLFLYASGVKQRAAGEAQKIRKVCPSLAGELTPERARAFEEALDNLRLRSKKVSAAEIAFNEAKSVFEKVSKVSVAAAQTAAERAAGLKGAVALKKREAALLEEAKKRLDEARDAYLGAAGVFYKEEELRANPPAAILRALESRKEARQKLLKKLDAASQACQEAGKTKAIAKQKLAGENEAHEIASKKFDDTEKTLNEKVENRVKIWGDLDPAAEHERLTLSCGKTAKDLRESIEALNKRREAVVAAEEGIKTLTERLADEDRKVVEANAAFEVALRSSNFEDAQALQTAAMPIGRIEVVEKRVAAAKEAFDGARGALEEAERRSKAAQAEKTALAKAWMLADDAEPDLTKAKRIGWLSADAQTLTLEEAELDFKSKDALGIQGEIKEKLAQDDKRRKEVAEVQKSLAAAQKKLAGWARLNGLIGQQEGKLFRRAAQRLTFRTLLSNANEILRQMDSRYELFSAGEDGLEVSVRDQDLAGLERTSANLSGGETFLVSLALALALARISSRNLQVDTLFLDEGFGSLDAQALDKALTALEALQARSKKLIGLISHVKAVRDRIDCHIVVRPRGVSGESGISGPGVTRL